jgi:hypothetical protein
MELGIQLNACEMIEHLLAFPYGVISTIGDTTLQLSDNELR